MDNQEFRKKIRELRDNGIDFHDTQGILIVNHLLEAQNINLEDSFTEEVQAYSTSIFSAACRYLYNPNHLFTDTPTRKFLLDVLSYIVVKEYITDKAVEIILNPYRIPSEEFLTRLKSGARFEESDLYMPVPQEMQGMTRIKTIKVAAASLTPPPSVNPNVAAANLTPPPLANPNVAAASLTPPPLANPTQPLTQEPPASYLSRFHVWLTSDFECCSLDTVLKIIAIVLYILIAPTLLVIDMAGCCNEALPQQ